MSGHLMSFKSFRVLQQALERKVWIGHGRTGLHWDLSGVPLDIGWGLSTQNPLPSVRSHSDGAAPRRHPLSGKAKGQKNTRLQIDCM